MKQFQLKWQENQRVFIFVSKQVYYLFNFITFKIVKSCSAYDCTNTFEKGGIRFHGFPMKAEELHKMSYSSMLCEKHFNPEDYH